MDGKCVIVGAGEFMEKSLPVDAGDYVIAADGGLAYLEKLGIVPDMVVGDFDSLNRIPLHPNVLRLPVEKDDTDMKAALLEGIRRGYGRFDMYGCLGGRIDHTIANLQLLAWLVEQGLCGMLYGNEQKLLMLKGPGRLTFSTEEKGMISVFSYTERCTGVSEYGLHYSVENYTMTNDSPLGVSNEFLGKEAAVSVEEGILLIVTERQR